MMNKLMKKLAVALTAATMSITATGAIAHANEIQEIEAVDVSVDDCISKSIPCYGFGGSSKRSRDTSNEIKEIENLDVTIDDCISKVNFRWILNDLD